MKPVLKVNVTSSEFSGSASLRADFFRGKVFSFLNPDAVIRRHPVSSWYHVKAEKQHFSLIIPFQECFLQAGEWMFRCQAEGVALFANDPLDIDVMPYNNDTLMELTCTPKGSFWVYVDTEFYLLEVRQQYGKRYAHLRAGF